MDDFEKLEKRLMRNPAFRKEHESTRVEFEISRTIIRARIEKGLTQKQLAQIAGTKQSAISRLEGGNSNPSIAFLKKVSTALGSRLQVSI